MKRRIVLKAMVAGSVLGVGSAVADETFPLTQRDAEGPFYPVEDIPVTESLFISPDALGDPLNFSGVISDRDGHRLHNMRIEIWQCDANRSYNHPADNGKRDAAFRGYAAQYSDTGGRFAFRTIVPVAYAGRPPHIHVKLWRDTQELLTTQVYLEGHRGSQSRKIDPAAVTGGGGEFEAEFRFVV